MKRVFPNRPKRIVRFCGIGLVVLVAALWMRRRGEVELPPGTYYTVHRTNLLVSVSERGELKSANELSVRNNLEGVSQIIYLVPEGTLVHEGDLLVELDSSELRDRINQQEIAHQEGVLLYRQAEEEIKVQKSVVESNIKAATLAVELAESDLEKYRDADGPQQIKNLEGSIQILEEQLGMAQRRMLRTEELLQSEHATRSELEADRLSFKRTQIQLDQSQENLRLVQKFDQPNGLRQLESNLQQAQDELIRLQQRSAAEIAQVEADLRTAKSSLEVMELSLQQLRRQLELAKIHAPQEGMVVYAEANQSARDLNRFAALGGGARGGRFGGFRGDFGGGGFRDGGRRRERGSRNRGAGGGTGRTSGGGTITPAPVSSTGGGSSASAASSSSSAARGSSSGTGSSRQTSASSTRTPSSTAGSASPTTSTTPSSALTSSSSASPLTEISFSSVSQSESPIFSQQSQSLRSLDARSTALLAGNSGNQGSRERPSDTIEEGAFVRQRQPLIMLPDLSAMLAEVKVPESRVRQIQRGMPAYVKIDTLPGKQFQGSVRRVAVLPDSATAWQSPDVKVYATEVIIEEELPLVKPGVSARADIIITNLSGVITVPIQAVDRVQGQQLCYVHTRNGPKPVPVSSGWFNDQFIEITSGLKEGDRVLLALPKQTQTPESSNASSEPKPTESSAGANSEATSMTQEKPSAGFGRGN